MIVLGVLLFLVAPGVVAAEILRCVWLETRRDRIPILLYHRLIPRRDVERGLVPDREPVYAAYDDVFASQMGHLREAGFTTLGLDEFLEIRAGRAARPPKPVVITFDDGYSSVHSRAWPALRARAQKATVFAVPDPDAYTRGLVAGIDGFLSEAQMRELDRAGVAIESHTLTHCVLRDLDDQAARHELVESRRRLEAILGRPVRHLAVPRSGHSARVKRLIREAGYVTACGNRKGSSNGRSDLLDLPRIVIERDMTVDDFARALRPSAAVVLRLVGNLKRIPALLLGPVTTQRIRRALYVGPLGGLFQTRRLKRVLAGGAILYLLAIALFALYLASR